MVLAAQLGLPAPAQAQEPGSNGRIVYSEFSGEDSTGLVTINADGSDPVRIPVSTYGKWSPDGTRLLTSVPLTDDGPIVPATMSSDGSNLSVFSISGPLASLDWGPCVWLPTGDRVLCKGQSFGTTTDLDGIYSMSAVDGGDPVRLTVNPYPAQGDFGGGDVPGDVSPDGKQFVFMRARPDPGHHPGRAQSGALFVADVDGSNLRQITSFGLPNSHDDGFESWSPDGSTIVFASDHGDLFTIHPDGSTLARVPIKGIGSRSWAWAPCWSPDGTEIVMGLYLGSTGQRDIYTVHPDGTGLSRLTTTGNGSVPDWGPAD